MSEFRRIMMSSFLMLLLHFTAAAGQLPFFTVRAGDEVTLPCDNVIHDQDECERTTWLFIGSGSSVTLFEDGQIHKEAKAKSDRLRVTEKCSLVIKKVTEEDAGLYFYKQYNKANRQQGPDTDFILFVVTMTEHQDNDEVTLNCSVVPYRWCRHKVKWLLQVTDSENVQTFSPQSSGRLRLIMVSVGLAALIITVVTVNIWTRAKGSKAQTEENMEQNDEDEDEDEDEVNYENDGGPSASV
ncbi:Lymphocyte antigen 6 complex locus protein G6f [Dissostichus eleginoides]|uniref:Lymphocyte antigen 6 complex locus protein G6f n=1 Tax=Dissostichus eleginoides TaxID=100907 RepID=A0AAD9BVN6_DISEL|nr:Lymphocyte antigen 6 complex locus protein G6f [Dissostichus eleginoides]